MATYINDVSLNDLLVNFTTINKDVEYLKGLLYNTRTDISFNIGTFQSPPSNTTIQVNISNIVNLYNNVYNNATKTTTTNPSITYYDFNINNTDNIKIKITNTDYHNTLLQTVKNKIEEAVARLYQLGITDIRHDLDGKMNELLQGENSLFMKSEGEHDSTIYTNLLWTVAGTSLLFIFFMNI